MTHRSVDIGDMFFSASLTPMQRNWLLGLLVLWALLLFGGFIFGAPDAENTRRMPLWTRMASSIVLVAAAWSWFIFSRDTGIERYALLIAIGMTLGFLGDLFMAGVIPLPQHLLFGIGSFGIGHIFYIVAMLGLASQAGLTAAGPRWGAWAVWLLVGLGGWYLVAFRGQEHTLLTWIALPYALLLATTAGVATGLALQSSVFIPLAIGAVLFLISDLILAAVALFHVASFPLVHDVVWLTYGPAQMLIVYSVGAALTYFST